jgi:hypothetical protein
VRLVVGQKRAEAGAIARPLVGLRDFGRTGRGRFGVGDELERDLTHPQFVARLELPLAFELGRLVVQERAVAAAQVLDEVRVAFPQNLAMVAADRSDLDVNVALGMPPEDALFALQLVAFAGLGPGERLQIVVGHTSGRHEKA